MKGFKVCRNAPPGVYRLREFFRGVLDSPAIRELFGAERDAVGEVAVEVRPGGGYAGVSEEDGRIFIAQEYLRNGRGIDIYLDMVHELVHVKQYREGRYLQDASRPYAERLTELDAWKATVKEARRIGLTEEEISEYLFADFITDQETKQKLADALGISLSNPP